LNIDFGINERQDCKIDTVCGRVLVGKGNGGDEDEGVGLIVFKYIKEIE
jgi:hypothetical protein